MRWWHIPHLLELEADLFGVERWSAAMFWNELACGHHYLVALEGEDVVGYAGLAESGPAEAWVNTLGVRRDRQRLGIGAILLELLLEHAHGRGVRSVLLEVATDNQPAQALYDRYGFTVVGLRRGYYQASGTDALVLRRDYDSERETMR
jgi:ribosomal-protein-alanine N-acetyltransferase